MHTWTLADPLKDVEYIVELGQKMLALETGCPLKTDPQVFRHHVTISAANQHFDKYKEFLAVAKEDPYSILGYCWFDRGGYTTYSRDEICNAKFHHVDMDLPVKTRVRLINEMIDQQILWAAFCKIPVICSTSIRGDYTGFMKMHRKRGFSIHGSYGWIRTEQAIKQLHGSR